MAVAVKPCVLLQRSCGACVRARVSAYAHALTMDTAPRPWYGYARVHTRAPLLSQRATRHATRDTRHAHHAGMSRVSLASDRVAEQGPGGKMLFSCSTRRHVLLLNKNTCLLVEQEDMSTCSARGHVFSFNKKTCLPVQQEDTSSC